MAENEVDLGLLLWTLERSVNADALGTQQSVVQLNFTDQPSGSERWCFVNTKGRCELCLGDPGFDTTLYLTCTLPDMIRIVRGDLPLNKALASDRLEAIGSVHAMNRLATWLNLGPLAQIKSQQVEIADLNPEA